MEINYNIVLYIGIGLIIGGFILFLIAQHFERQAVGQWAIKEIA